MASFCRYPEPVTVIIAGPWRICYDGEVWAMFRDGERVQPENYRITAQVDGVVELGIGGTRYPIECWHRLSDSVL